MTKLEKELYQLSEHEYLSKYYVVINDEYLTIDVEDLHENDIEDIVNKIEDIIDELDLSLCVDYDGNHGCIPINWNLTLGEYHHDNRTELSVIFCDR